MSHRSPPSKAANCPHFSIQGAEVVVPGALLRVRLPAPSCVLSTVSIDPDHPGFPPTQFGPDGYPVMASTCSRRRYLTCCRVAAAIPVQVAPLTASTHVTCSVGAGFTRVALHSAILEARARRARAVHCRSEARKAIERARATKVRAATMVGLSRRMVEP